MALVAGVYFGAAKFGLTLGYENTSITAVWPPTGIALVALLLGGYRMWPAVALGAFLANSWTGVPLPAVLGLAAGNTLEAVAGAFLLRRVARFQPALERVRDVAALAVLAGALSTMASATIGVASLWVAGRVSSGELASAWRVWWLGDMGGDLLVAPALLLFARPFRLDLRPARIAEVVVSGSALVGVGLLFLSRPTPLAFALFPLLMWAAIRFGQRGAALATVVVAGIAVYFTSRGLGPFVRGSPDDSLLGSQMFMGFTATTALLLAAITAERERARRALRSAHDALELKVRKRTADLANANDALRKSELQLAEAQRVAYIGSWEWDIAADDVHWSDELYRIYGLDREQFGASYEAFLACVHPDDRQAADEAVRTAFADPGQFDFDHRVIRPDGEVRTLHARGRVEVDEDGTPVRMFGTGHDVTERELERREADRLKDEFFALVSHELRTPLSSVKGYVELLLDGRAGAETNARGREFALTIARNASRLESLVDDLLFAAQLQSGALALHPEDTVDLSELLADRVEAAAQDAAERTIELVLTSEASCGCTGNRDRLSQVFDNLISNALTYTPKGGRVDVTLEKRDDTAIVSIRDTGIGIAQADRHRVFGRFFRAPAVRERIPGLGLGLSTAKAIAELYGGRIAIESEEGAGSTVRFEIPLAGAVGARATPTGTGVAQ